MAFYNKKIILTPVINAPNPKDLIPLNHNRSINMNFSQTNYQDYMTYKNDEYINSLRNSDVNISTGYVNTNRTKISIRRNSCNLKQFELKPRLKTNKLDEFVFNPKIENKVQLENNILSLFQNKENFNSFLPENAVTENNICSDLLLCSKSSENVKPNQTAMKTIKKFKFDKYKYISHSSLDNQNHLCSDNQQKENFDNNRKENLAHDLNIFRNKPNSNCLVTTNVAQKDNVCSDLPLSCSKVNENIKQTESTTKNIKKFKFKDISIPYQNKPNHLYINQETNQETKNLSNLNTSGIEPILTNGTNSLNKDHNFSYDENNIELRKFESQSSERQNTPNSEDWLTNIPDELDQLLDSSNNILNNNSTIEKNIETNNLDLKTLNKIDYFSNLFSNDADLKFQINTNEQFLNKSITLQTNNICSIERNQINMFNLPDNVNNLKNFEEVFNVTQNKMEDLSESNNTNEQTILETNEMIKNDFSNIPLTKILQSDSNTKSIDKEIRCFNKINVEHKDNKKIEINANVRPMTTTATHLLDEKVESKNISNTINNADVNNFEIHEPNINFHCTDLVITNKVLDNETSLSSDSTKKATSFVKKDRKIITNEPNNNIKKCVSKQNCKPTKIVKRKCYVMEIDKSCTDPPPKTVQTKITSLLKPIKESPEIEQNKPVAEKSNKKYSCAIKSCLEVTGGKRKITDHFSIIKKHKTCDNKKMENTNEEKKHIPKFKKNKFCAPVVKQQAQENKSRYDICTLNEETINNFENYLDTTPLDEISFNIIFKENCCLLSQMHKGNSNMTYSPIGIIIHVFWNFEIIPEVKYPEFYYIKLSKPHWKDISIPRALIRKLFTNNCRKICFKAQTLIILLMDTFEFSIQEIELNWIILDPIVGCWLLDPDNSATTFADVLIQLKIKQSIKNLTSNAFDVACDMVIQLSAAMKKLQYLLEEKKLFDVFVNIEMKVLTILSGMEFCGILVNTDILQSFGKVLKNKLDIIENKAYESVGRVFQINSTVQLRTILYDELKLDVKNDISIQQTTTLGAKSTSEPMLQLLQKVHPLPGLVLEYRHLSKVKSTYVDAMIQHVRNGTIYSKWEQTSAATGRIASSNPNLQAIPKQPFPLTLFPENSGESDEAKLHLRSAYISRPGYSLLAADFQHIELRVFAHLSQDKAIIKALNEPGDIFISLTRTWLGNSTEEISKKQREETKRLVYATMYGAGPPKIAGILKISAEEATHVIKNFTNKFPSLKEFSRSSIELCQKQGFLRSLSGRCRLFPNIKNPIFKIKAQAERQAINFRIQGSAADICKSAMISAQENLKGFNCKLLLQIHDELVWEVLDEHVSEVWEIVKKVMEDTDTICGKLINFSVPLPVSINVGKNWGEMTE